MKLEFAEFDEKLLAENVKDVPDMLIRLDGARRYTKTEYVRKINGLTGDYSQSGLFLHLPAWLAQSEMRDITELVFKN